jgi:hypothetical protein
MSPINESVPRQPRNIDRAMFSLAGTESAKSQCSSARKDRSQFLRDMLADDLVKCMEDRCALTTSRPC